MRLFVVVLLLVGCASRDMDQAGNVYTPQCTVAATLAEPSQVTFMDPVIFAAMVNPSSHELGVWIPSPTPGEDIIWIDDTLTGWKKDDALRHEKCHELMHRLTGDGQWHD